MPGRGVADTMGQACKSCREVLDQVQELLESRQVASGMELLMARLSAIRHEYGSELWELLGSEAVNHPVSRLIWQDPFTSHRVTPPTTLGRLDRHAALRDDGREAADSREPHREDRPAARAAVGLSGLCRDSVHPPLWYRLTR